MSVGTEVGKGKPIKVFLRRRKTSLGSKFWT